MRSKWKFMTDILKIKALRWEKVAITPPGVARDVWFRMQQFSSIEDPLRATKAEQNKKALRFILLSRKYYMKVLILS